MELNIKKAVIHILDRESNEPLLNEFELEMNDDISAFLEKHIVKAMNDDDSGKARFKEGRNIIKEASIKMASDEWFFLEGSREIARQLFKAMKTNSSISSTDLIVCLYEEDGHPGVAILKMDYNTSFIHEVEMIEDKFKITIKKQEISLPGTNQKIQKCAFIRAFEGAADYDMIILDNQVAASSSKDPVAQFFLQTFLGADIVSDSKHCTRLFKKETENWIKGKMKEGETSVEEIRNHVFSTIRQEDEVDINEFSSKAFGGKVELREEFVSNLKEKGLANERFEVDKEWVDRKLSKIRIKTESGIEIVVPYDLYSDKEAFEVVSNGDGTRNIVIKGVLSLTEK